MFLGVEVWTFNCERRMGPRRMKNRNGVPLRLLFCAMQWRCDNTNSFETTLYPRLSNILLFPMHCVPAWSDLSPAETAPSEWEFR